MTGAWLMPIGVLLLSLGAFKDIAEEWPARGLTDTSYSTLALLVAGELTLAGFAAWFSVDGCLDLPPAVLVTSIVMPSIEALVFATMAGLKLRDRRRSRRRR